MKIFTVVGARPQFVKAAVVSRALRHMNLGEEIFVHTGQHFDENMSEVFFRELEIPKPDYNLYINRMSHGKMTGRMLEGLEELMVKTKPDAVLVYGDTNSTLAGALSAAKLHIPIAHVEAGLRSFNTEMPEEINRILTDRISQWLFCPTDKAIQNLSREGYTDVCIKNVGDVMYDAVLHYKEKLLEYPSQLSKLPDQFILTTLHRQENTDNKERLSTLINCLNNIHHNLTRVVMPLHPGTAKKLQEYGIKVEFQTIDPVGYFDMLRLLNNCQFVMTDSGGLQKEAYFFKKFCITMRDQTEWVELVEEGVNRLVGVNSETLLSQTYEINPRSFPTSKKLYGTGNAGELIVKELLS